MTKEDTLGPHAHSSQTCTTHVYMYTQNDLHSTMQHYHMAMDTACTGETEEWAITANLSHIRNSQPHAHTTPSKQRNRR